MTGIYAVAERIQRTIPTAVNDVTHETIHPSVLRQAHPHPDVLRAVQAAPALLWRLLPHEEVVREHWRVMRAPADTSTEKDDSGAGRNISHVLHAAKVAVRDGHNVGKAIVEAIKHKEGGDGRRVGEHPLAQLAGESSMGSVVKELLADQKSS